LSNLSESKTDRKRQPRGEARIKSLLEAAEIVFARDGYHNATTNEISATAKVSPATLYQFFSNKEAIANSLARSYADKLAALHGEMDFESFSNMKLLDMVSAVMDPLFKFHRSHPAFLSLLLDAPLSQETKFAKHALTENFIARMATLFRLRSPQLGSDEADWAAQVCMMVFKGFISEINSSSGKRRQRLTEEFKHLLVSYLQARLS
jgi:AcrR family transcriptional regulator